MKVNSLQSSLNEGHCLEVSKNEDIRQSAEKYFTEIMKDGRRVQIRPLCTDKGFNIYEAYTDSGSNDYLYLTQPQSRKPL